MAPHSGDTTETRRLMLDLMQPRAVARFLDERSLLHLPGASGLAGDYQGRAAIVALLEAMASASSRTARFEVLRVTSGAPRTWRFAGHIQGERAGHVLDIPAEVHVRMTDDHVQQAWVDCSDQAALDRFWG